MGTWPWFWTSGLQISDRTLFHRIYSSQLLWATQLVVVFYASPRKLIHHSVKQVLSSSLKGQGNWGSENTSILPKIKRPKSGNLGVQTPDLRCPASPPPPSACPRLAERKAAVWWYWDWKLSSQCLLNAGTTPKVNSILYMKFVVVRKHLRHDYFSSILTVGLFE